MEKDYNYLKRIILSAVEVIIAAFLLLTPIVKVQMWVVTGEWSYLSMIQGLFYGTDPYGLGAELTDTESVLIGILAVYITFTIVLCFAAAYQSYRDNYVCLYVSNTLTILLVIFSYIFLLVDYREWESAAISGSVGIGYWIALILAIAGIVLAASNISKPEVKEATTSNNTNRDEYSEGYPFISKSVLEFIRGEYTGAKIDLLEGEEIVLGRSEQMCQLIFTSPDISRKHCSIRYVPLEGAYYITDYSTVGTFINNSLRLPKDLPTKVNIGEIVSLGQGNNKIILDGTI